MNHEKVKKTVSGVSRQVTFVNYCKTILCLVAGMLFPSLLFCQNFLINQRDLKKEDGLASYLIEDICQDQLGFVWIATNEGVNRYDGYEFKLFNNQTHPLIRSDYTKIFAAPDGNIWLIANGNQLIDSVAVWSNVQIVILDPLREQAYTFQDYFRKNIPFAEKDVVFIAQVGKTQELVITTSSGTVFSYSKKFSKRFDTPLPVGPIIPIDAQSYWKIGNKILLESNVHGDTLSKDRIGMRPIYFRYRAEELIMATGSHLEMGKARLVYKKRGQYLNQFAPPQTQVPLDLAKMTNAAFDRTGGICFYDQKAMWWFRPELSHTVVIPYENNRMTHDRFFTLFFDRNNQLWAGGHSALSIIEVKKNPFQTYLDSSFYNPRGITIQKNEIVANTYKGLMRISLETTGNKGIKKLADFAGRGLWQDTDRLWVAGPRNEVRSIKNDPFTIEKLLIPIPAGKSLILQANCLIKDKKSRLWIGTNIGLAMLPETGGNIEWPDLPKLTNIQINQLYENREGLWIGAKTGLYLMNVFTKRVFKILDLGYSDIQFIFEAPDGNFWLATKEGGLLFWDRQQKSIRRFTNLDGLSSNTIYGIFQDKEGSLWLPSGYGLMRMDLPSHLITTFFKRDGLPGDEFNPYSSFQSEDGRFIFGGENGLAVFSPDMIRQKDAKMHQRVVFTKLEKLEKATGQLLDVTKLFRQEKVLTMRPEDGFLLIHVSAQEFANPGKINFAYRVDKLQKDWTFIRDHSFRLGGLPFGKYTLSVKAQGAFGQWTEPITVKLEVMAPYYWQPWFWVVVIGFIVLLAIVGYQLRFLQIKETNISLDKEVARRTETIAAQKEELERINRLKDRIFMIIGHELRGPAISLSTLSDTVSYLIQKGKIERAILLGKDADRTAKGLKILIDNLLSWGRAHTEQLLLLPEQFNPADIARESLEFFSLSIQEKGLILEVNFEERFELFLDKNAFRIVFLNLLSNAIKFSKPNGLIQIVGFCCAEGQNAILKISDSGIGIPPERLNTLFEGNQPSVPGTKGERGVGIGLAVCKELVNINGGLITVDSKLGEGTIFTVHFPIGTKNT
jgi:signal transduction histidine kinase/ligand-binding sensor domain-containing protein